MAIAGKIKRMVKNENLIMIGGGMIFSGFYAIAELQIFGGLLMVFLGYTTIISTTEFARCAFNSLIIRLKKTQIE